MLKIDDSKLRALLESRSKYIKSHKDIIGAFMALLSYTVSVLLSGILTADTKVQIIVLVAGILYFIIFIASIHNSRYSVETLFREIVSCSEDHKFSLMVLKNTDGKYLLKYDRRWKTYLFPYTKTKENDEKEIFEFIRISSGLSPKAILKQTETDVTKHSVSANMDKTYHHIFYQVSFDSSRKAAKKTFHHNGTKYKWFSIDEMKLNKGIVSKNIETVKFVEENF